jgi:phosphatidylglycerophosphatase C
MTVALFDFDGTITTHETMPAFVRGSVRAHRLLAGYALLFPLLAGYRLRIVSACLLRAWIVRLAYAGTPAAELERHGRAFAHDALDKVLRPEAMARIAWHRAQGHTVAIVSGGLDAYLRPWAERHGLDVICSSLEQRDGVLTGRYAGPQCVREHKVRAARDRLGIAPGRRVFAYGDTPEDHAMLAMATDPFYRAMPAPGDAPGCAGPAAHRPLATRGAGTG